ncbi:MAG: hypothetical protein L0Y71_24160 [Gemmataceae bacterium]|nr:hypothetical protein [Gemmataceae bacterium]
MATHLDAIFPRLADGGYAVTSARSRRYNCVAWAAGDDGRWWWPGLDLEVEYWPAGVPRVEALESFQAVFAQLGYVVCADENPESGFEKIAIFTSNSIEPKHAARQLPGGRWTSKLGVLEDIEHGLHDLEGDEYGTVRIVMKRPRTS